MSSDSRALRPPLAPSLEALGAVGAAAVAAMLVAVAARTLSPLTVGVAVGIVATAVFVRVSPLAAVFAIALVRASAEGLEDIEAIQVAGISLGVPDAINVAFLLGAVWWFFAYVRKGGKVLDLPLVIPLAIFFGIVCISLLYSSTPISGIKDVMKLASAAIAAPLIVASASSSKRLVPIAAAIVVGSVYPVGLGLLHFMESSGFDFASHGGLRVLSVFAHPNHFGVYLVVVMAAAWGLRNALEGPVRVLVDIAGLAASLMMILTLSRSAWLAAGILAVVLGWKNRRILIACAVAAPAIVLVMPRVLDRITDALQTSGAAASSTAIRFEIWSFAFPFWLQEPFVGHGWGSFLALSDGVYAHNDYLRILLETGIVGSAAFLFLMWKLIRRAVAGAAHSELPRAFFGLALGYVLIGLVTNSLDKLAFQWYFWALAGVALAWPRVFPPSHLPSDPRRQSRTVSP